MKLTRKEVEATIKCGDGIAVIYRNPNGIAKLLRFFEKGKASHFIECLGGLDTVEETIGGGMRTNLYTYLRGDCDLIVKRARGSLDLREEKIVRDYWLSLVDKGYGWDSIKRSLLTVPIRRYIKPRFPRLAWALIGFARWLLPGTMPDCSAAWIRGIRLVRGHVLGGFEPEEVDPEEILRDHFLLTVARWKAPILEDK